MARPRARPQSSPRDLGVQDINPVYGITGTPVIDPSGGILYVVSFTLEGGNYVLRLHALDVATGAEKLGGPVTIHASVPGAGVGSSGGTLTFDPKWENQRAGLLLLHGVLYIPFAAHGDLGPWHGWILSYNASTLRQISAFCTTPNGTAGGVWMSGTGPAAEVVDSATKPYGRMFFATGNGDYTARKPYKTGMDYGNTILNMDLTNGVPTVTDEFTPYNQQALDQNDGDLGSGGVVLLPGDQLVQVGKQAKIYLVNRDNMGGYSGSFDNATQELANGSTGDGSSKSEWGAGLWGSPAYWNGHVYIGGSGESSADGSSLKAFSLSGGRLSASPISESAQVFHFPGPTPSISSNGARNGILWALQNEGHTTGAPAVLWAYDANNLANVLYSSNMNPADNPGSAVKYALPLVVNGKVYVGEATVTDEALGQLDVYGLLNQSRGGGQSLPNYPPGTGFTERGLALNGATISGTVLQMTRSGEGATTTAYFATPVDIRAFTTDFDFQIKYCCASGGFTFIVQNEGFGAIGISGGSGLGSHGVNSSVATKFDNHNNAGEGNDSTGIYLDGAMPTIPATDLSDTGINLGDGDVIHAHIVYDGANLTLKLTDASNGAKFTHAYPVNIPHEVGGNMAYVGFTAAGSGSGTPTQNILDWTYITQ